jgi:hypothetical protein
MVMAGMPHLDYSTEPDPEPYPITDPEELPWIETWEDPPTVVAGVET